MSHPTRTKVHCFCQKCSGKLVDPRTRDRHRLKYKYANNYQEVGPSNVEPSYANDDYNYQQEAGPSDVEPSDVEPSTSYDISNYDSLPVITDSLPETIEPLFEKNFSFLTKRMPIYESAKSQKIRKGKISDRVLVNLSSGDEIDEDDDVYVDSEDFDDADDEDIDSDDFENVDDDDGNSEDFDDDEDSDSEDKDENEEVNFASTGLDYDEPDLPNINVNYNYTWVIL